MKVFNWCFIGTGKLANTVAKQILKTGRHKIVSCYTRNYEKAEKFAEKYGATAYRDAKDAITAENVDGVYVVTPHNAHYRFTRLALELGKPVLCEKAFTVTASETEDLINLAREKDLYLCEAMWTWFSPTAYSVKSTLENGVLGKITKADFSYNMKSMNYAQRVTDPKRAGGALLDITVYPITYAYRLWGYPEKIESVGTVKNGIDESETVTFTYNGGLSVKITGSVVDYKGGEKMKIVGEKGYIKSAFYHNNKRFNVYTDKHKRVKDGNGVFYSYLNEFDNVAKEIKNGLKESKFVPLNATYDVMKIMDEIRLQIGLDYDNLE